MHAVRIVLLALCCASSAAAQELPSAQVLREAEFRREGALLPVQHAVEESRRAIAVLRAYAATGEEKYFHDALRRARHLAAFEPRAATPEDSLTIAWALALAHEWLAPRLHAAERASLHDALRSRAALLFNKAWPESVPALLVIARTLAGDEPQERPLLLKLGREMS